MEGNRALASHPPLTQPVAWKVDWKDKCIQSTQVLRLEVEVQGGGAQWSQGLIGWWVNAGLTMNSLKHSGDPSSSHMRQRRVWEACVQLPCCYCLLPH